MNADNKSTFMRTVRESLGFPGNRRRPAPPGLFPHSPSPASLDQIARIEARGRADRRRLLDMLLRAAEPIRLSVRLVDSVKDAAAAIADEVAASPVEWGGPRQVFAWDHPLVDSLALPSVLAVRGIPVVSSAACADRAFVRQAIIDSFVGVTAADFCVADTATLVLRTRPGQPRSVSLVPSIHIAVITVDQILADFKELYAALRWGSATRPVELTTCMTFISGPSKTADIEATLVHGAHGPRAVSLYVVEAA